MALSIDPVRSPDATIPPIGEIGFARFPDVQPFSQRAASGYQDTVEGLIAYLRKLYAYLVLESPQGVWDANVQLLITAINAALDAQTSDVEQKITDAITAIAQSQITVTDPAFLAVLQQAQSQSRVWLDAQYAPKAGYTALSAAFAGVQRFYAPDPNGTDDTAALQALFDAMMNSTGIGSGPGEVILGPGIYRGNWILNAGFWSGKIKGRGKQATYLQSLDQSKAVLRVTGNPGSLTSGALEDVTIAGTDLSSGDVRRGIGTELYNIGGFQIERVQYTNLDQGHRWMTDGVGGFTEFCVLRDINMNHCTTPLTYDGAGSYHGSGVDGNSVVGMIVNGLFMVIKAGAIVYNAPLNVTVFAAVGSTQGNMIVNTAGNQPASFTGALRAEIQGGEYWVGWAAGAAVFLAGTINLWGGPCHLGTFFLVDKIQYTGGLVLAYLRPWHHSQTLSADFSPLMGGAPIIGPGTFEGSIDIFGPNGYWYALSVRCWNSDTSIPAVITVTAEHYFNDPGNVGKPAFSWNNGLQLKNVNFNTQYKASVSWSHKVHKQPGDNLGQY